LGGPVAAQLAKIKLIRESWLFRLVVVPVLTGLYVEGLSSSFNILGISFPQETQLTFCHFEPCKTALQADEKPGEYHDRRLVHILYPDPMDTYL
jgi:hypothetical protein